tara:strand:+ start:326 stop:823 length:498 start_codon:yes stop_codon:yes gene_type:complete
MKRIVILGFFLQILFGTEILLIDGTKINGEIISSSNTQLQIKVSYSDDLIQINKDNIIDIDFENLIEKKSSSIDQTNIGDFSATAKNLEKAGKYLVDFRSLYYTGFFIQIATSAVVLLSDGSNSMPILLIGSGMGLILQLMSISKVGEAGEELDEAAEELIRISE